jgi:glycosyltransferase involved in cell wall biosynthesis
VKPRRTTIKIVLIVENCSYLRDARMSKQAQALREDGFDVTVISPALVWKFQHQLIDGIDVFEFPHTGSAASALGYTLEYLYATLAITFLTFYLWITRGIDIIQVANPPDCIVPVLQVCRWLGVRIVYDQHDLAPDLYRARFRKPWKTLYNMQVWLEGLSHKFSDHTIVTNESYRRVALERHRMPESRVTIVRNGPEVKLISKLSIDEDLRKKSPHIFVFAGVVGFQDGLDRLCRALSALRTKHGRSDFLCVIVGDGAALPATKSLVTRLDLEQHVLFTGWIDGPERYFRYLETADICLSPEPSNEYNDRSTLVKIMEYMLAGKPIVAFELPETCASADGAALFAKPNDEEDFAAKLVTLMDNPEMCKRMGDAGRKRVCDRLAWEHQVPAFLSVYRSVVPKLG